MADTLISFDVQVVDGEVLPVPGLEIGARFGYPTIPSTWSSSTTDGDGTARFSDEHAEPPETVCLYVGEGPCGTFPVEDGSRLVLEM